MGLQPKPQRHLGGQWVGLQTGIGKVIIKSMGMTYVTSGIRNAAATSEETSYSPGTIDNNGARVALGREGTRLVEGRNCPFLRNTYIAPAEVELCVGDNVVCVAHSNIRKTPKC
jgi:hypothetical protein